MAARRTQSVKATTHFSTLTERKNYRNTPVYEICTV